MTLALVKNFTNRMYAEQAQHLLEREGIQSIIQSPDIGLLGTGGLFLGADLLVAQDDVAKAQQILAETLPK